jgi:hypothetical protein
MSPPRAAKAIRPETAHAWSPDRSDQHTHRAFNESYFCLVQAQSFAQLHTPLLSHSQLFLPHALQLMVSSGAAIEFQTRKVAMGFCGDPDLSRALRRLEVLGLRGLIAGRS